MLLELPDLVRDFNLNITGIVHVGAHLGEEAEVYSRYTDNVWWIEGNPGVMGKLQGLLAPYPTHHLINALVTNQDYGQRIFHVSNYDGMSSSVFPFGQLHLDSSPDTIFVGDLKLETRTLDSLVKEHHITGVNMLCMDLQGAELLALKGASKLLGGIDYVYTEVNDDFVYEGCALVGELDELLFGFTRVETRWTPARWGDALFCRNHSGEL